MTSQPYPCRPRAVPSPAVVRVREWAELGFAAHEQLLRAVAAWTGPLEADLVAQADREREQGSVFARSPHAALEEARSTVTDEVAVALGLPRWKARTVAVQARRLVTVLPQVLQRLGDGRLDVERVTLLVRAVEHLSDDRARQVADGVLAQDDARLRRLGLTERGKVWDLVQVPAWRDHVHREIANAAKDDPPPPPVVPSLVRFVDDARHGELVLTGSAADVIALHSAIQDVTAALVPSDATGPDGRRLRSGEREALGLQLALAGVSTTGGLPDSVAGAPRSRELGLVMNADTLLDDGPAADDGGQVRGTGRPVHLPAQDARRDAAAALARGVITRLLLADRAGRLVRMLQIGAAPDGGWTRAALLRAGRSALATQKRQPTGHDPTTAMSEHVRAAHPTSCGPATGASTHSGSSVVDLDHVVPYPHGPTSTHDLRPLHRTPHRRKTRGVWHAALLENGDLEWTTRSGLTWTHEDEPLPGYATGEGRACAAP